MSTHILPFDCDRFAAQLADYLEGDLADGARVAMAAHASSCPECGQLLSDLEVLRHDAAALPALTPSRDLWDGIAERIDAAVVVPMDAPRVVRPVRRTWVRPAIAAAALVVFTAGVTHVLTRVSYAPGGVSGAVRRDAATDSPRTRQGVVATSVGKDGEIESTATERPPAPNAAPARELREPAASGAGSGRRGLTLASGSRAARPADALPAIREAEPVYDREIVKLRRILKERRSELDPKTIAVLEQSIAVIDSAIVQSRAALTKDPASGFLAGQLNHSLEKKVELLRTAALLPART